jgi:DNA-binding CsgD family transcriptional regulator
MAEDRTSALTQTQKVCLRLVYAHMSSKDIALKLDCSPHTVDAHIKAAMHRLGVGSRREAARELALAEQIDPYQSLVTQPAAIADLLPYPPLPDRRQTNGEGTGLGSNVVQEDKLLFVSSPPYSEQRTQLPFPQRWGEKNDLNTMQRLMWVIILIIFMSLGTGAILAGMSALEQLL